MKTIINRLVRRLTQFAWIDVLRDVSRVEWKYGRNDDGTIKDWEEWNDVRDHLVEAGALRKPDELKVEQLVSELKGEQFASPSCVGDRCSVCKCNMSANQQDWFLMVRVCNDCYEKGIK